jgi:hypothetical protein
MINVYSSFFDLTCFKAVISSTSLLASDYCQGLYFFEAASCSIDFALPETISPALMYGSNASKRSFKITFLMISRRRDLFIISVTSILSAIIFRRLLKVSYLTRVSYSFGFHHFKLYNFDFKKSQIP